PSWTPSASSRRAEASAAAVEAHHADDPGAPDVVVLDQGAVLDVAQTLFVVDEGADAVAVADRHGQHGCGACGRQSARRREGGVVGIGGFLSGDAVIALDARVAAAAHIRHRLQQADGRHALVADRAVVLKTGVVAGGVSLDAASDDYIARQTFEGVKGRIGAAPGPVQALGVARRTARTQLNARMDIVARDGVPAQAIQAVGVDDIAIGGRAPGGEVETLGLVARDAAAPDKAAADVDLPRLRRFQRLERL